MQLSISGRHTLQGESLAETEDKVEEYYNGHYNQDCCAVFVEGGDIPYLFCDLYLFDDGDGISLDDTESVSQEPILVFNGLVRDDQCIDYGGGIRVQGGGSASAIVLVQ